MLALRENLGRCAAALAYGLSLACGDGATEPVRLEGQFALQTANGQPLPADVVDGCRGTTFQLLEGSLRFFAVSMVERVTRLRSATQPTQPPAVWTDTATVALTGSRVVFEYRNTTDTGAVSGSGVSVTAHLSCRETATAVLHYSK
jgi:hypothetical protein